MNRIIYWAVYLLSRSPLISITLDQQFHNISSNNFSVDDLRISLFSMGLGIKKLYIFSWKKNDKFSFIKILSLNKINKLPTEIEINEKTNLYHEHINSKRNDEIKVETDFLKYKINENEETKKMAFSKMNNYITIMLFLIPLILTNMLKITDKLNLKLKILFISAIIYNLINIVIYLLDYYNIKSFSRSTFSNLKQSDKHLNKLAESYYEDWYSIKKEAPFFVTYVINTERYVKYCVLFLFITFCTNSASGLFMNNSRITTISESLSKNTVCYVGFNNNGQVNKKYSSELVNLYNKVEKQNIKQIIIIKRLSNGEISNKQYELVLNSIKMFNSRNVNIIEIDEDIDTIETNNYIKIITLGGNK